MQDYELYGFSVFETLAAHKGAFWRLREHWERLAAAAETFNLDAPSWPAFVNALAVNHDASIDQVLRYTLVKSGGRWSEETSSTRFSVLTSPLTPAKSKATLTLAEDRLPSDDVMRCYKTGSRMLYQARFLEARDEGFDDVLFADVRDRILETTTANLLALLDGEWLTPPLMDGILPGIYREWLLERDLIKERSLELKDLENCEGLAITNAVRGIIPVARVDQKPYTIEKARALEEKAGSRNRLPLADYLNSED